jgi:hypothetical protein
LTFNTVAFPNHPEKVAMWKKAMGIGEDDDDDDDES